MTKKTKTLLLSGILLVLATASGLGIWLMNRNTKTGTGNVLGITWYDENGTEFTISTADELYELAELSKHYDFEEQTIKLGADITVNEGKAEDWLLVYPERQWYPIEGFAGTFDGQGHTISGLCGDGTRYSIDRTGKEIVTIPTGLFANTQGKCTIKDLRVVNSLFVSDVDNGVGTITAEGSGSFEKIYSSALLVTYKSHAGGIVGQLNATGNTTITNCWFDGEIRVEGNVGRFIGGIVGRVYECKGQNQIEHCLSTGTFDSPVTGKGVNMGGLIGNVDTKGKVTVTDCLSVGQLSNEYGISVGAVIGCNQGNLIVNDTYATNDSYKNVVGAVLKDMVGSPIGYDREMLTGEEAYKWTTLDFAQHWAIQKDSTPVLQCFAEEVPSTKGLEKAFDVSWYEKNKKEYSISNMEEMYGLAILSYKTNFAGKTVKLVADLTVNDGKAVEWKTAAPKTKWIQIGSLGYPFNGVFDGQMHSISGVYQKMTDKNGGIFASTGKGATVKNLKLVNSYFEASEQSIGSIVGTGRGKFHAIYSDAIIQSTHGHIGGLIGQVATDFGVAAENCWFDGEIRALGNDPKNRRTAGIIGYVQKDSTLSNCLNTGTIDASVYTAANNATSKVVAPCVGGLVGDESGSKIKLTITDSLNAGVIKYNEAATAAYGSAVGYSTGTTTFSGVYATKESCKVASGGHVDGRVIVVDEADISGLKGYQWTHLNFDENWAVVVNPQADTPILKAFAPETPSVASTHRMVDVSWYDSKKNSFTLDSKEDLYGFYIISHSDDFKDKTVRLGKNITVNTGDAASWVSKAPAYEWKVIGSAQHPFAGTFDGRMKTISGLYQNTEERFGGLFATGVETTKIQNVIIENSYFKSTADGGADIAAVLGRSMGCTLDTIYVKGNVTVDGDGDRVAGVVGLTGGETKTTINNCWNGATIINRSKDLQNTGGIVGMAHENTTIMSNCLNSGVIDVTAYAKKNASGKLIPMAGGLLGQVNKGAKLSMKSCLNVGLIKVPKDAHGGYGSLMGYESSVPGATLVVNTYATKESCKLLGFSKGNGKMLAREEMLGYRGFQWTNLDFEKYWTVVVNPTEDTPILKSFAPTVPSLSGYAKMSDTSWYDASKSEYVLSDMQDLYGFYQLSQNTSFAGKTIKLGNDITVNTGDAKTWATDAPIYIWRSIGSSNSKFAGTFDGQGYAISGLYQNTDTRFGGLFADTSATAEFKNIRISNSYFKSTFANNANLAAISGRAWGGTFDTIYVDDTVIITACGPYIGGIVAMTTGNVKMSNCWNAASIVNSSTDKQNTGGLVGCVLQGTTNMTNCLNSGTVDVSVYTKPISASNTRKAVLAGGLVGHVVYDTKAQTYGKAVMNSCLNVGKIVLPEGLVGGQGATIGWIDNVAKALDATTVYATKESCSRHGIDSLADKFVTAAEIRGFKAYEWTELDFDKYWSVVETGTPILKSFADTIPSLEGYTRMIDTTWYNQASGTKDDPYKISDMQDLYGLASLSRMTNFAGSHIVLTNDIQVNEGKAKDWADSAPTFNWSSIGSTTRPFNGHFDGQGKTISGVYLNSSTNTNGLFAYTGKEAVIEKFKLKNCYLKSSGTNFGGITGIADGGVYKNIYSDAIVESSNARTGGLIGMVGLEDKTITFMMENCWFNGRMTNISVNQKNTGGLIGILYQGTSTMKNCLNTATVDVTAYVTPEKNNAARVWPYVGGLVGNTNNRAIAFENCLNVGRILTDSAVNNWFGSITGYGYSNQTYTNVYATNESCKWSTGDGAIKGGKKVAESTLLGETAKITLIGFDFDNTWTVVAYNTPVLKAFAEETRQDIDMSWYDGSKENGKVYELKDSADFNGLTVLAQTHNFAGQTIKLTDSIVLNSGDAAEWSEANKTPGDKWIPIGKKAGGDPLKFAGTFDGQMFTISGVYCNESTRYTGLFADLASTAVIKNFKLTNSYIKSTVTGLANVAAIAGRSCAKEISSIYVDSTVSVVANGHGTAGIVALVAANTEIKQCWNAASINNINASANKIGGIIGQAYEGKIELTDCLNTGAITSARVAPQSAGLVGGSDAVSTTEVIIKNSLNVGTIPSNTAVAANIMGYMTKGSLTCTNVFGLKNLGPMYGTLCTASCIKKAPIEIANADAIKGDAAKTVLTGFDFTSDTPIWKTVTEGTPVLNLQYK